MYIFQSNQLENLFTALCNTIAAPLAEPLTAEIIVVQSPGMARWLSQHIALENGIAANLVFPLPASFIWSIFETTLGQAPDLSGFERDVLLWRILAELDSLPTEPAMQEITAYLADDRDSSKRFQLAAKITDLFDQYQVYRPKMLLDWEKGRDDHWQAILWRQLTSTGNRHRAALLQQFLTGYDAGRLLTEDLPERVCFFGINSLAPAYLEVIDRISATVDVHLFQLSPCQQAWDDILPERLLAIKRQSWRKQGLDDISDYFTTGNPLLASMGAVGREFFCQLMQLHPEEVDLYREHGANSLLAMIQNDILNLHNRSREQAAPLPPDNSIHFHSCHSPMREVQVLHDRLLDLFQAEPDLKPADILVMAPDINRYAPAVAGVFGSARDRLRIPWSIADRSRNTEQPVIEGFLGILDLVNSRFTAPEVVALLENRAILSRFAMDEGDFAAMRSMVRQAGIRWGLDQQQRREQGLDDSGSYTWDFGLQRLLLGYLTGSLNEPLLGILPCGSGLNSAESWLGSLADFIRMLQRVRKQFQFACSPDKWSRILGQILTDFFNDNNSADQDGLLFLRETIADFADCCQQADFDQPIDFSIVRSHFQQLLAEPAGGQAFLSGRVTFCNMVPMRSVPFKVIWLLGMNDSDYPRFQRPTDFDLIARDPAPGDRSRRDDDRYLFLEALLSARSNLSISWVGQNQQDNSTLPPSVVVAELQDYINRGWQSPADASSTAAADRLTTRYPLQPFSRHCFDGTPETASYASEWLPVPDDQDDPAAPFIFCEQPLPPLQEDQHQLNINQLIRFWNHPTRYFLSQRLGLQTYHQDDLLPETETFAMDYLQKYLLANDIVTCLHTSQQPDTAFYRYQAAGELPSGAFADLIFQEMTNEARDLARSLEPFTRQPLDPREIDLIINDTRLTGTLSLLYSEGRVTFRAAKVKAKDILQLWINHLVLLLQEPPEVQPVSIHAGSDTIICFREVDNPEDELARLLHYYYQGCSEPLHFYPKTSHVYAAKAMKKSEEDALKAAKTAWYGGFYSSGEEDESYQIALRGQVVLDEEFKELTTLFIPILQAMETCNATN